MKEFLYVGHYLDKIGNYMLKIGTTNDLERRRKEHNRTYKNSPHHKMAEDGNFEYDWYLPLTSKYARHFLYSINFHYVLKTLVKVNSYF